MEESAVLLVVQLVVFNFANLDVEEGAHCGKTHLSNKEDLFILSDQLIHQENLVEQFGRIPAKTTNDSGCLAFKIFLTWGTLNVACLNIEWEWLHEELS